MALTELQKAQNKAAQLVRNRAHAARLQQYRREMDAVDAEPEVVQARKKFDPDLRSANPVIHGREDVNLAPLRRGISASPWPTRGAPGSLWPVHEFARDRPVGLPF